MTTRAQEETIIEIGKIMLKSARQSAEEQFGDHNKWDYAGYVFQEGSGDLFLFYKKEYYDYGFGDEMYRIITLFEEFRDLTQVEGDKPWLKCKAVIRNDGDLRMLFEFDDKNKWTITPGNLEKQYEILIEDIFPENETE